MTTPSAKAAQQIGRLFESRWARREAEPVLPVEIEAIIQQAIAEAVRTYALAAALAMKEKCAVVLSTSPRKVIYECAAHIRTNVKPVTMKEVEMFLPEALEALSQPKGGEKV